ncbi:MAG: hypothetical protein ACW99A_20980, partial [Candidatus Kariarchaeaceae archaeon]
MNNEVDPDELRLNQKLINLEIEKAHKIFNIRDYEPFYKIWDIILSSKKTLEQNHSTFVSEDFILQFLNNNFEKLEQIKLIL